MPSGRGTSNVSVPQNECIVTPNHFSGENDFSFALLNSRSCENDLFSLAEIHAHIVQKCLRAEVRRMCLSRRTSVSLPRTTSRARMTSASPCLIRDPVRTISSPWLKFTPISSRNAFGQRYVECVCPAERVYRYPEPLLGRE